jgi:two-component system chemotaxis response regulator CheY
MERRRILIVEDSATMRKLIALALGRIKGVDVVEATDGMDGLRKLTSDAFHLAIVDINMPVMNGIQLIELMRAEKKMAGIPILVVTTEGADEDRKRALAAGANGYLTKPVEPSKVAEAVKKLLEAA